MTIEQFSEAVHALVKQAQDAGLDEDEIATELEAIILSLNE